MLEVAWSQLKEFVQNRSLSIQWVVVGSNYYLKAADGYFELTSILPTDRDVSTDTQDFEDNFKANGNKRLDQRDSDGSQLTRTKITTTGWHYQLHGMEFETSKLNSLESKKADGSDWNLTTIKFYELINNIETQIVGENLTQEYLDIHCIKTVIDWEPTFDIDIIGGKLRQASPPTEAVDLWVVGAPDIPAAYGGSKEFVSNLDLELMGDGVAIDGKTPKYVTYNSTYHSSKFRLILRHPAGFKHELHMIFEIFKA